MFKISRRLEYGVKLMVALAKDEYNLPKPTSKLSERLQIPLPFLHQIGHSLMQAGLIKATPGPRGGLRLNLPAGQISILTITESLEGPITLIDCQDIPSQSTQEMDCPSLDMWIRVQDRITAILDSIRLNDLVKEDSVMEHLNKNFSASVDF